MNSPAPQVEQKLLDPASSRFRHHMNSTLASFLIRDLANIVSEYMFVDLYRTPQWLNQRPGRFLHPCVADDTEDTLTFQMGPVNVHSVLQVTLVLRPPPESDLFGLFVRSADPLQSRLVVSGPESEIISALDKMEAEFVGYRLGNED